MSTKVKSRIRVSPKEKILKLIGESTDEGLGGKKSVWRSKLYIDNIGFSDVADIVLQYISLQPDLVKIANIKSYDFYALLEEVWDEWREKAEKRWGYRRCEFFGQTHTISRLSDVSRAWNSGPGPMGGTMGAAEHYAYIAPGFLQFKYLLVFLRYPEGLADIPGNWPSYRKNHTEAMVLPKWRRKMHAEKLKTVFQLAEMVCQRMRENKK